jgi:hypothetical protein
VRSSACRITAGHSCAAYGHLTVAVGLAARCRTRYGGKLLRGDRFSSPGAGLDHVWMAHSWVHPLPGMLDFIALFQYIGEGGGGG